MRWGERCLRTNPPAALGGGWELAGKDPTLCSDAQSAPAPRRQGSLICWYTLSRSIPLSITSLFSPSTCMSSNLRLQLCCGGSHSDPSVLLVCTPGSPFSAVLRRFYCLSATKRAFSPPWPLPQQAETRPKSPSCYVNKAPSCFQS